MNNAEPRQRQYWAFISYSHRDADWGNWLHKQLETYKVPKKLVGRPNRTGTVPKRLYPIFRDREELPTSANLGSIIQRGLENSTYLVVICSPRSAASLWVNQEILTFKAMGKADRVLALIVDGEPNAASKPGLEDQECFPEALRFHVNPDGTLSDQPAEPVAADARSFGDGKRNALLKLLAGLLGVDYAILNDREHKRRLRRYLIASTACFVAVATALGIWGVQEQRRLRDLHVEHQKTVEQRNIALRNLSAIHLKEGRLALSRQETGPALLRLDASLRSFDSLGARVCTGLALPGFVPELAAFPLHQGQVQALTLAADEGDGQLVISSGMDDRVKITRLDGLEEKAAFSPAPWVYALAAAPQGHVLAAGMDGVRRLEPETGAATLLPHASCPGCTYAVSSRATLVAVRDPAEGDIRVVAAQDGQVRATVSPPMQPSGIMAFSADETMLAVGGADGTVLLWDVQADAAVGSLAGLSGQVSALAFSPDGGLLAAGEGQFLGGPGAVQVLVWSMGQSSSAPPVARLKGHEQQINNLAFSPDGRVLASNSQADLALRLWDTAQFNPELFDNPLFTFQPLASLPQQDMVTALGFTTDGSLLLTADIKGEVHALLVPEHSGRLPVPAAFSSVATARDGSLLALLHPGGGMTLLDVQARTEEVHVDTGPMTSAMALSADGSLLAWAEQGRVVLRDLRGQAPDNEFVTDIPVQAMAFAPDASGLALAGQGALRILSLDQGTVTASWQASADRVSDTASLAFSHDGRFVALSSNFGPVVLATVDGAEQPVSGYEQAVFSLDFSPAGGGAPAMLLAGCLDGLVRRWSLEDWKELDPLRGHPLLVSSLAADSKGTLYATSAGNALRLWSAPEGELLHTWATNLIGLDSVHLPREGDLFVWGSSYLNVLAGEDLQRGDMVPLLERLHGMLELGFPSGMDRNGELVPRQAVEVARLRLEAATTGNFPWPLRQGAISEATLAKALEARQETIDREK